MDCGKDLPGLYVIHRELLWGKSKYCFDRILSTVFFFNEKYFKCASSLWSLNFSEIHIPCILYNMKIANFNSPPIFTHEIIMKFSWQNTLFSFIYLVPFTSNHRSSVEDKWIISRRSIKENSKKYWGNEKRGLWKEKLLRQGYLC